MKLRDLSEKFSNHTPEVDTPARVGGFSHRSTRMNNFEVEDSFKELAAFMHKRGWRFVGKGHFSSTYDNANHPGWILKLMPERDLGYMRFYSLAKRSNNPHFPEVSKMGILNVPHPMYAVMVEKLTPRDYMETVAFQNVITYFMEGSIHDLPPKYKQLYPELEEALHAVRNLTKLIRKGEPVYTDDLHYNNIMWRGNVPVIIDPIANRDEIR